MKNIHLHHGDCLEVLKTLPDCSVDSIVTDPPYGLTTNKKGGSGTASVNLENPYGRARIGTGNGAGGFMGMKWDSDVPPVEVWAECLRVLKPGGHLLAFAGTRTQHRMAVRIEDAGFEIRDMIAWVYGSGFPKSMDVSKAIDKAAGLEREVIGKRIKYEIGGSQTFAQDAWTQANRGKIELDVTAPATDAARQWQGWGTALKPALETVTFASKPYTAEQERDIIQSNLIRLEARIWLLSSASAAEKNSTSNPSEYGAACAIAQWSADEIINTRAALCGQMGTSRFELATTISLSIVSSWRRTLAESWSDGSTSTIGTRLSTTIDWRTLKFSLSQITPESIIKACSLPGGFSANASTAESHFNASLSLLQSIRTLSATEPAISQAQHEHLGAGVKPNLDPCILARKPLGAGTVAANVLAHGTGALNIDGCRVGWPDGKAPEIGTPAWGGPAKKLTAVPGQDGETVERTEPHSAGRWPANLIHDGSEEVLAGFPQTAPSKSGGKAGPIGYHAGGNGADRGGHDDNGGSAARFFYCAKASKRDRDEGLDGFSLAKTNDGRKVDADNAYQRGATLRANTHPTVKPTDLMRYLLRLVTPPGGVALDPYMGSGSTGKAAVLEGFGFIGIEREAEYIAIAQARIDAASRRGLLL